jgi:hypothetical protein
VVFGKPFSFYEPDFDPCSRHADLSECIAIQVMISTITPNGTPLPNACTPYTRHQLAARLHCAGPRD